MARERRGEPDLPPGPARELVDQWRRLRQARPLTNGEIAVKTGLARGHISEVLAGWKRPGPATAEKITKALTESPDEIVTTCRLAEQLAELSRYRRKAGGVSSAESVKPSPSSSRQQIVDTQPGGVSFVVMDGNINFYPDGQR